MLKAREVKKRLMVKEFSMRKLKDDYFRHPGGQAIDVDKRGFPEGKRRRHDHGLQKASGFVMEQELGGTYLHMSLPLSLEMAVSSHNMKPDVRIRLFDIRLGSPVDLGNQGKDWISYNPKTYKAPNWKKGLHCGSSMNNRLTRSIPSCTAALTLASAMFPDSVGKATVRAVAPAALVASAHMLWHWWKFYKSESEEKEFKPGWAVYRGRVASVAFSSTQKLWLLAADASFRISAASLLLSAGYYFWAAVNSGSLDIASATLALVAVMADRKHLQQQIAHGGVSQGPQAEAAWHAHHKRSARRVAHHLTTLYETPPLGKLINVLESTSVITGGRYIGGTASLLCHGRGVLSIVVSVPRPSRKPVAKHEEEDAFNTVTVPSTQPSPQALQPPSSSSDPSPGEPLQQLSSSPNTPFANFEIMPATSAEKLLETSAAKETVDASSDPPSPAQGTPTPTTHHVTFAGVPEFGVDGSNPTPALYGRSDHNTAEPQLTFSLFIELVIRGVFLMAVFAPFLTSGVCLLLMSSFCSNMALRTQVPHRLSPAEAAELIHSLHVHREGNWYKSMVLCRRAAWHFLLFGCRASGAAMIKWAQWAATRADIFPEDFCDIMSALHEHAPTHSYLESKKEVEASFGLPIDTLFIDFQEEALASGSIAQVHRAKLRMKDGSLREVVVKVRHPKVAHNIWLDFQVLKPLASAASGIPALKFANLKQSISMFSHTMTAQCDMRVEAAHLRRFASNFSGAANQVTTPRPIPGLVTEGVLVETFEPGRSVSYYTKNRTPVNTEIVSLGVDTYLGMLLQHNFVHTDLHPGNIMVRMLDHDGGTVSMDAAEQMAIDENEKQEQQQSRAGAKKKQQLQPVTKSDGELACKHLLHWAEEQLCPNPGAFKQDVLALFQEWCNVHAKEGVDLDRVMKAVLRLCSEHEVSVDSSYASLVIAVCVIVGFATSLDPEVNIIDAAASCLLYYNLSGRVMGRMYG
eukprot:gene15242-21324_t